LKNNGILEHGAKFVVCRLIRPDGLVSIGAFQNFLIGIDLHISGLSLDSFLIYITAKTTKN